ncbi:hypothetical protein [Clostridium botulinum]|uniref:hypothetical protein n=1 Tax=Clostridium botulinum TaxID=1491 RepID=UPI001E49BEE3|nr:hypothetical protein [Clostridium botulinum]MCD3223971.1 hypothetical protein [Clostridium botulinum C/D]
MNILAWIGLICCGSSVIINSVMFILGKVNNRKDGISLFLYTVINILFVVKFYKYLFCM